ncbi:MAG: hypothetical protein FWF66_07800 [Candidatus Bathyarchaeota archaeon]|nr:hypothetical protein [Candidatus Termiticorpusculum sp.]MCL1971338.1 hypothetical protein [Candidatus Termiticorpusculum sp.]
MGRIDKGEKCSVSGCGNEAERSISADKVKAAGLKVNSDKRAYLCKEHYKEYKKKSKKDKLLDKWRHRM